MTHDLDHSVTTLGKCVLNLFEKYFRSYGTFKSADVAVVEKLAV